MAVNDTEWQTQWRQQLNGHRDGHPTGADCHAEGLNDQCLRGWMLPFEIYCGCSRMISSKPMLALQTVLSGDWLTMKFDCDCTTYFRSGG